MRLASESLPDILLPDILLIAPPQGRRALAFQASLERLGWPSARVVSYLDVLEGRAHLAELVRPGSVVRFESPGEDVPTELHLIERGGGASVDLAAGELAPLRAWYAGFSEVLAVLDAQLAQAAPHHRMQRSEHILSMFSKPETHARLSAAGVSVAPALPEIHSFDELMAQANERGWTRLFVKPAYGSSGSGVVALRWNARNQVGGQIIARTTARRIEGRLYNSRRLVNLTTRSEIVALIDDLATHRLHVEQWLPKISVDGLTSDLRVVVIGGRAQHTLLRSSSGPVTNLHLGNKRGDIEAFKRSLGEKRWADVQQLAESALAAFPGALYAGVDVLVTPRAKALAVLEVNAFGDYHRGVEFGGHDTYAAELLALQGEINAQRP
ncbi:STM4014 family protein [Deinococcus sp.]|uniref:STM4014 family protein n=1 Tax=Deinococcus sp. TaxID=47478 RepID=UPI0025E1D4B4|nr:STM4014 family protein [Deinococcus sp.]